MAAPSEDAEILAGRLRSFADSELREYSPLYERIVRGLADDGELLERLAPLAGPNRLPGLVLAAVHDAVLAQPDLALAAVYAGGEGDPWPLFAELVDERFDQLAEVIATRSIQTNEVGRCTALVPALAAASEVLGIEAQRPLALVDVGSSAGLNLLLDRYSYSYLSPSGELLASWGDGASPVQLTCDVVGDLPPLPPPGLPLAARVGVDLEPIDVRDEAAGRWLEACLWPDVPNRAERLRGAVSVARLEPPDLRRGDATELLAPLVRELPPEVVPCIVSTWALAYLNTEGRQLLHEQLAEVGAERDLALVTAEYPHVTPWIPGPDRGPDVEEGKGATLLGLSAWRAGHHVARPLAWMQAHGQWIDWLER